MRSAPSSPSVAARAPSSREFGRTCVLASLLVVGALACSGPGEARGERDDRSAMSDETLRELLERGTIRPVESTGDPYDGIQPRLAPAELGGARVAAQSSQAAPVEPTPVEPTPVEPTTDDPTTEAAPTENTVVAPPPRIEDPFFNPWAEFGARITYDAATQLVTKPYPLRLGMGQKIFDLIQEYGDFRFHDPEAGPQQPEEIDLVLLGKFDVETITPDLRAPNNATGTPIAVADWLVARARPEVLREFEYFLNTFISSPPQIEIEAKIVEVVTRDTFDMGVSDFLATLPEKAFFDTIGFNLPNRSANELLLEVGTISDGTQYSALIELLATFENVSIISRPRSAVREGGRARVEAIERIPYLEVVSVTTTGGFNTTLKYLDVGVRLFVTPRLVGSRVALEIDVEASQQTGDAVTVASSEGEIVTTPILSTRQARTLVYLRPGEAVILGGLITERTLDEERKVPFLGDLPVLGALFRSTFQSKAKAQVLFFIRPRVMQGGDLSYEF